MTAAEAAENGNQPVRYKRRLRNYLLDVGLQLRYTAPIVVVAALLTAGLGYMIYQATRDTSRIIEMTGLVDPVTAELMRGEFAAKDQKVLFGIIGFGLVLMLSVAAAGILITHKIAGPLFNISRLLERIRQNQLAPPLRKLRKGDELQEFYNVVSDMHMALRDRVEGEVRVLDEIATTLGNARDPAQDAALGRLRDLTAEKRASLDA